MHHTEKSINTQQDNKVLVEKSSKICKFEAKDFINGSEENNKGKFTAYISTFGNEDRDGDIIEKGAFLNVLKRISQIPMLWMHDSGSIPIGIWKNLQEDMLGLKAEGEIFLDTPVANGFGSSATAGDIYNAIKTQRINSTSIGFRTSRSNIHFDSTKDTRIIKEIDDLMEASIVVIPANEQAKIVDIIKTSNKLSEVEGILKNKGFSNKEAKAVISKIKELNNSEERDVHTESKQAIENKREACSNEVQNIDCELQLIKSINESINKHLSFYQKKEESEVMFSLKKLLNK